MQRVLILGAGFSFAAAGLPMLKELGDLTLKPLEGDGFQAKGRNLEEVMSRLSENQPDLGEAENLLNRSRFINLTDRVANELSRKLNGWTTPPDWLWSLVALAHLGQYTIISFNYDTVIELVLRHHEIRDRANDARITEDHILDNLPPPEQANQYGHRPGESFNLLKLHGSLNWWWVPGDLYGASLVRQRIGLSRSRPPGRERFIVPPVATKGSLYTSPILREIWSRSRAALATADDIAILGYSLPVTDIAVRSLIAEAVEPDTPVTIVNPAPDDVYKQLAQMGLTDINLVDGSDCIEKFVGDLESTASARLVERLVDAQGDQDPLLVVGLNNSGMARGVVDMFRQDNVVVLKTSESLNPRAAKMHWPKGEKVSSLSELIRVVRPGDELALSIDDSTSIRLVDYFDFGSDTGSSSAWICLVPGTPPPWWSSVFDL